MFTFKPNKMKITLQNSTLMILVHSVTGGLTRMAQEHLPNRNPLIIILIFILTGTLNAQQAQLIQRTENLEIRAKTSDIAGDIYLTGTIFGNTQIGTNTLNLHGIRNSIVYKMDTLGNIIWAKNLQDPMPGVQNIFQQAVGIILTGQQELWVMGTYSDTMQINGVTYTSFPVQQTKTYIVRMNPGNGAILGVDIGATTGSMIAECLYKDAQDNIYFSGAISDSVTFPGFSLGSTGISGGIIAKLDPMGNLLWQTPILGVFAAPANIHVDNQNNVYSTFDTQNSTNLSIGNTPITIPWQNQMNHSAAILKLNSGGVYLWHSVMDGYGTLNVGASDLSGNIYFSGHVDSIVVLFNMPLTTQAYSNDAIVGKVDANGNLLWVKQYGNQGQEGFTNMTMDQNNNLILGGYMTHSLTLNNHFLPGNLYQMRSLIMSIDLNGNINWAINDHSQDLASWSAFIHITTGNNILFSHAARRNSINTGLGSLNFLGANYGLTNYIGNNFIYYVRNTFNNISGTIFLDNNANGVLDIGEKGVIGMPVGLSNGYSYGNTDFQGKFTLISDTGNTSVILNNPYSNYTITTNPLPGAYFPTGSMTDTANNVGLYCPPNIFDLSIQVVPLTLPRFFTPFLYQIDYVNQGSMSQSANITMVLPPNLNYIQSSITPGNILGQTITWSLPNLIPLQKGSILLQTEFTNMNFSVGDTIFIPTYIDPTSNDANPQNNQSLDTSIVVGPYDPNFKRVNRKELTAAEVQGTPWLQYTIHFQNIGGDTAFNVLIKDTLSPMLNPATLQIVSSSAPVQFFHDPNGACSFSFLGIELPDSGTNFVGSMGYVCYRIQTKPGLQPGMVISNFADIYFDYNEPIRTDTANTLITYPVSVNSDTDLPNLSVFPNPVQSGYFNLQLPAQMESGIIEIYSVTGTKVLERQVTPSAASGIVSINVSELPNGVYWGKVWQGGQYRAFKIVCHRE